MLLWFLNLDLLYFGSSLNMIAFTKIMKKFDKVMVLSVINQ